MSKCQNYQDINQQNIKTLKKKCHKSKSQNIKMSILVRSLHPPNTEASTTQDHAITKLIGTREESENDK